MTFENRMDAMCAKDRQDANRFLAMIFDEQVIFSRKNPSAIRTFAAMLFCRLHEECRVTGEKFAALDCEPSRSLVRNYIEQPRSRNAYKEETAEHAFRHVRMCRDDQCKKFQKWLDSLRESCDPQVKDLIRRWDNEPNPFEQLQNPGPYHSEINPN